MSKTKKRSRQQHRHNKTHKQCPISLKPLYQLCMVEKYPFRTSAKIHCPSRRFSVDTASCL